MQDDVNPHMLRMLEETLSPDAAQRLMITSQHSHLQERSNDTYVQAGLDLHRPPLSHIPIVCDGNRDKRAYTLKGVFSHSD